MKANIFKWRLRGKLIFILFALSVYSFIPVVLLYRAPNVPTYTNAQAIEKIKAFEDLQNDGLMKDLFGFIVFGDNHAGLLFNDDCHLKVIRSINQEGEHERVKFDFVLSTGDLTFRGREWDYQILNKLRARIKFPIVTTYGNHDDDNEGGPRFEEMIGEKTFSFSYRNCYFIFLDNSSNSVTDEQFDWLEQELKKSLKYTHRFILAHKSPVSAQLHTWFRQEVVSWSYRMMKLCEKYELDYFLAGHEHLYRASKFGGVTYITSGGAGTMPIVPPSQGGFLHYLVFKVDGDYIDYKVSKVQPPFWQLITGYVWKDLALFVKDIFS